MDGKFKKNGSIKGKFKMLNIENGVFISQDGKVIPISEFIESEELPKEKKEPSKD